MQLGLTVLTLLLSISSTSAAAFDHKDIRSLDATNFNRLVRGSDKLTVAVLYAPWCGYCKKLVPEYIKAASNLKGLVNLVAVDCDEEINKKLCQEQEVKGFPTIKIFPGGKAPSTNYDGPRTAKGIAEYVLTRMPTFVKKISSAKALEEIKDQAALSTKYATPNEKPVVILFTASATVGSMYKALSSTFHKTMDLYTVRESTVGKEAMEKFGVTKVPTLVVLEGGEVKIYDGELKLTPMVAYLKSISEAVKLKAKLAMSKSEL